MNKSQAESVTRMLNALIDAGRFHHDGNLATVWMFSNVEVFEDRNENIFPRKSRPSNKIDAGIGTIVAMNRALAAGESTGRSFWEQPEETEQTYQTQ